LNCGQRNCDLKPASGRKTNDMAAWYSVNKYSAEVSTLEVHKETDQMIFFMHNGRERRQAKVSSFEIWFPSREEALNHFIEESKRKIDFYERKAEKLRDLIKSAKEKIVS